MQNGDGVISAKELGSLLREMGRNPTEDELMNIMNEIDVDHNGNSFFLNDTYIFKTVSLFYWFILLPIYFSILNIFRQVRLFRIHHNDAGKVDSWERWGGNNACI